MCGCKRILSLLVGRLIFAHATDDDVTTQGGWNFVWASTHLEDTQHSSSCWMIDFCSCTDDDVTTQGRWDFVCGHLSRLEDTPSFSEDCFFVALLMMMSRLKRGEIVCGCEHIFRILIVRKNWR